MRVLAFSLVTLLAAPALAQPADYADRLAEDRAAFDAELADPATTLLDPRVRAVFDGLPYYPVDPAYRVEAAFTPTPDAEPFAMRTSAGTEQVYVEAGTAAFRLGGADLVLHAYRPVPSDMDSLFVPFRDATTGTATYGGGRYLYVLPPEAGRVVLDFNAASNPYCAYDEGYACPLPPSENTLAVPVEAGVQAPPLAWLDLAHAPLPADWARAESPEGTFAAAFPFAPTPHTEQSDSGVRVETLELRLGETAFFGTAVTFPRALTAEEQGAIVEAGLRQGVSQDGTLVERADMTVAGHPAVRARYDTPQGPMEAVVFATGPHLATFTVASEDPALAERFFASLEWLVAP